MCFLRSRVCACARVRVRAHNAYAGGVAYTRTHVHEKIPFGLGLEEDILGVGSHDVFILHLPPHPSKSLQIPAAIWRASLTPTQA